ncbi:glycosyltransferase [Roseomonas sp. OT10]|uniref:glycosyltransferase n=1 Tax=Roseomonas cutis TaxID=2897332 RepID=UPI001E499CDF|nr:glycosyltransferase [Roseomonas sp. OT10]UFN50141.1 glycosyltransferase [Roseomonas sp. OT10]
MSGPALAWLLALPGVVVAAFWAWAPLAWLRRARPAGVRRDGPVTLILPLAGNPPGLPALLGDLAAQSLRPARLIVAVEAGDAAARAAGLHAPLPFPVTVVEAPQAADCGQKCANQLAALARLDGTEAAVVLLDADIRPQPWWLSTLASPILDGSADMVTGYRWLLPRGGLATQAVAWLDRALALVPRSGMLPLCWGGSLALGPAALPQAARTLERVLSDDLALSAMARREGLRVLTRRILLVPSPFAGTAGAVLGFYLRQHRILHLYAPGTWRVAFAAGQAMLALWLALAVAAPLLLPLLPAAGALRWWAHGALGRRIGAPDPFGTRAAQLALALTPLPDLLNAAILWAALRTRRIAWRHVTYEVTAPDRVRVASRRPPGQPGA